MLYSRANNPNRHSLEQVLAAMEKGEDAAAFSSGNAAGTAVYQALAPGSHIVAPDDMYHGLHNSMVQLFAGIHEVTFVDMSDLKAVKNAIRPNTALFCVESPSNPLLKITDIREISALAKAQGALLACDNTFATPVFQNPIDLGADLVMHSSTKYFGGHSDILGGALITAKKDAFWEKIRNVQRIGGAVPSPRLLLFYSKYPYVGLPNERTCKQCECLGRIFSKSSPSRKSVLSRIGYPCQSCGGSQADAWLWRDGLLYVEGWGRSSRPTGIQTSLLRQRHEFGWGREFDRAQCSCRGTKYNYSS